MKNFRIGIIGAGSIVEGNHIPAITSLQHAGIEWVYDKNAHRSSLVSKMYGIPSLADGKVEEALKQVDICLLATPYGTRRPYIDLCRKFSTAVVIEKPFAFSREEHVAHCEGFREWEIAVNFQRRFYRSVAILRQIIRSALFGTLRSVRFAQGNFTLKGGSGYLSNVELAGGGVIAESASHVLDIILGITGAKGIRLCDSRSLHLAGLDYDTVFDSRLATAEGEIPIYCEVSTLRNLSNGLFLDFEHALVSCDLSPDGMIFVRNRENNSVEYSVKGESLYEGLPLQATRINEAFLIFWQQFIDGMQKQEANQTSAYTSILTSCWLEEIYRKIK